MKALSLSAALLTLLLIFGTFAQAGVILPPLNPATVEGMKSLNANQEAAIEFVNLTNLTVDVNWIDYGGNEVFYNTLAPGQSYQQGTFITHPWVIEVHGTDAPLVGFLAQTAQPFDSATPDIANINTPEPVSLLLLGSGFVAVAAKKRMWRAAGVRRSETSVG